MSARPLLTLSAISAGLAIAACCFPILATAAAQLGPWVAAPILAAGALCWLTSRVHAELGGMFPAAAGLRTWLGRAFGQHAGATAALLYLFLVVSLGAAETWLLTRVLALTLPGLPAIPTAAVFIAACTGLNLAGFEITGRVQAALTALVLGGVGAVALGALTTSAPPDAPVHLAPQLDALPTAFAALIFLYVGFEWVTSAAIEHAPSARAALPRAMSVAIGALAVTYALLGVAFSLALPADTLTAHPAPQILLADALAGPVGRFGLLAITAGATFTSFNSGLLGASRLVYALARERTLPGWLAALHPRTLTPHRAILATAAVTAASSLAVAFVDDVTTPVMIGACIECFAFAAACAAFARLRQREPQRRRPFRAPFNPLIALILAIVFVGIGLGALSATPAPLVTAGVALVLVALANGAAFLTRGAATATNLKKPDDLVKSA